MDEGPKAPPLPPPAWPPAPTPAAPEPSPIPAWLMPVGVSPWAIVAGYLGLFGLVIVPAPLALVAGLIAQRDLRRRPHLRGRARARFAVIVGVVGTALLLFSIGAIYGQSD